MVRNKSFGLFKGTQRLQGKSINEKKTYSRGIKGPSVSILHVLLCDVHRLGVDVYWNWGIGGKVLIPDCLDLVMDVLLWEAL